MKKRYTYSIAIRTLGSAGEKYKKLLDSIIKLKVQPEKLIVVLPEGYSYPEYRIGIEEFVYSPKGMILQRLKALEFITSDFTLFCDDDVEFAEDFVEKLVFPLLEGKYVCSAGPLLEFFPQNSLKYKLASLIGGACVMLRGKKNTYVRVLKTGGWSYNRNIDTQSSKIYRTESLPWTCFLIKTDVMKKIKFEDELWSEKHGYAAFEDRVMFYKLLKNGYESCVVSNACYIHNDAKASTKKMRLEPIYARAFNHYVFWHRYLYLLSKSPVEKVWTRICISYYILMSRFYSKLLVVVGKNSSEMDQEMKKGFADAKEYVNSLEYKSIPSVYQEKVG